MATTVIRPASGTDREQVSGHEGRHNATDRGGRDGEEYEEGEAPGPERRLQEQEGEEHGPDERPRSGASGLSCWTSAGAVDLGVVFDLEWDRCDAGS